MKTICFSIIASVLALTAGCAAEPPLAEKTAPQSSSAPGPQTAAQTPSSATLKSSKQGHEASWPSNVHPIVAVRYLAAVDEAAISSFRRRFNEGPFYLDHKRDDGDAYGGPPQASMPVLTVAQSTYFAVKLRERLAEMLPGAVVVLQPGRVVLSKASNKLEWEVPKDTLTPDLLLDFTAYVSPQPIVFEAGRFYMLVTMRVGSQFAPATHGLVATSRALSGFGNITEQGDPSDPYASLGSTLLDMIQSSDQEFKKMSPVLGQGLYASNVAWDGSKVLLFQRSFGNVVEITPEKTKTGEYTLSSADVGPIRDTIVDSLNLVIAQPMFGTLSTNFVVSFDPTLSSSRDNSNDARKLAALTQFREAEAKFVSKTSELMSESLKDSALAGSIRDYEAEQLSVARKAKVSAIFALVGAAAGVAAKNPTMTANANEQALTDMAQFEKSVRDVDLRIAETQSQVSVNVLDKEQTISASSLSELHAKLKIIYANAFPTTAPQVAVTKVSAVPPPAVGVVKVSTSK
jgi:hypothetical protein